MLFKISYSIKEELVHVTQTQFAGGDEKCYDMKLISRWHEPSSTGFMVVETDDYQAVMKYCQQWNRTCQLEVTPVGTDADAAATLSETLTT
jgi:hypothetical protein